MPYPDILNPELIDRIPLSARTVLDVGCGGGALGAEYKRRNPRARYFGIELDPDAARLAATRLDAVAEVDVEADPLPFGDTVFDCVLYGDVLEHLVDPWALLREHAKYLSPEGTVLVCMPNVEHWSFAARLLTGNFDYEEQGLFDHTHLRWFTPRMMGKALADAGLQLSDVSPRPIAREQAEQFVSALAPGLQALGVNPAEYLNRAVPLQFIWRARKSALARIELSATMLTPQGGVSDVRVIEPIRAMRTDSALLGTIASETDFDPRLQDSPRIAVLHRPLLLGESGIVRLRALLDKGYVIVSEFDDHPQFMEDRGVNLDDLLTFRGVHAIQTSTENLAEALRPQNPEIEVFRNGIFALPPVNNFNDPDHLTLFFGAINREADWAPLMPVLNEVARAVGERLRFHVLRDEGFYNALETPHKRFEPMTSYAEYMTMLGAADIAFMPLADTLFNRAKSDLKFIEAGAARVAALASNVVYAGSVQNGKTGMLFADPGELRVSLLRLLAYPEATRKMADAARAYVADERMLAYQVAPRTRWYRSLWERRAELNEALRARVPELFA